MITEVPFLADEESGAPVCINRNGSSNVVLVCEHASNHVPRRWNNLGLSSEDLKTHHAWDAGASDLTIELSKLLDAPAVLSGASRLFLDYNRPAFHPQQFPSRIDHADVPGNLDLSEDEMHERARIAYFPLSDLIEEILDERCSVDGSCVLVSVHSYEMEWEGVARPWPVGVVSEWDRRLAAPLVSLMREAQGQPVGDNEPYDGRVSRGNTLARHAGSRRLPNAALELRKDVLRDQGSLAHWSNIIASCLKAITISKLTQGENNAV